MSNYLTLKLIGSIVPKARPRITKNGTFMPPKYRQWKKNAIARLVNQTNERGLINIEVKVELVGKHSRRGDADNIIGSILDALVQSEIIKNDNLTCVTSISLTLSYSKIDPYSIITILDNDKNKG